MIKTVRLNKLYHVNQNKIRITLDFKCPHTHNAIFVNQMIGVYLYYKEEWYYYDVTQNLKEYEEFIFKVNEDILGISLDKLLMI